MKTIEEAAEKDPVIDPYTLGNVEDSGQNQFFMIMSGIACALVLPLIALLIYKILALYCKGQNVNTDEEELEKESYVKFETISMKQRAMNSHPAELWARRQTQESERMLLCSRSSIDSQMTYKSDSSRSEYLCWQQSMDTVSWTKTSFYAFQTLMGDRWWNYLTKVLGRFITIFDVVDVVVEGMTEKWFAIFF